MAYHEIFEGVVSSITASTIFTPVQHMVQRHMGIQGPSKQDAPADDPIISIPLAIGYYYNLLEKIDIQLAGNFTVKKHITDKENGTIEKLKLTKTQLNAITLDELEQLKSKALERTEILGVFGINDVSLELIYPKDLSNASLNDCSNFLQNQTEKGSIESIIAGRPMGINFLFNEQENSIKIVDYVRPIEAIPKFYREMRGIGGYGTNNEQWADIEENEMQGFFWALKFMIDNRSRFLYNTVAFKPLK